MTSKITLVLFIAFSHALPLFFWVYLEHGSPFGRSLPELQAQLYEALPSWVHLRNFFIFIVFQLLFAWLLPGYELEGMELDAETTELAANMKKKPKKTMRLYYLCNGYASFWATLSGLLLLHYFDIFSLTEIYRNWGQYMVSGMVFGNGLAFICYFYGLLTIPVRLTGDIVEDFFMGTTLYPRIGYVDIKMLAEIRWSWLVLFCITLSCAFNEYATKGYVGTSALFMVIAHWLYANAPVKGEHYVVSVWDIVYEKFGWMLCYWNVVGVPFIYCVQSIYIQKHGYEMPLWLFFVNLAALLFAYWVWDSANSQKATFKMPGHKRALFPIVPWAVLENPKVIETPHGKLLVDGWYQYARKIHYTADIVMAITWGVSCGFESLIPYFYSIFFLSMIIHRQYRDECKCQAKYGKQWDEYRRRVPAVFLPGLI